MILNKLKVWVLSLLSAASLICLPEYSKAQNFSFNCIRDTLIPGCQPSLCITLKALIPDIHGQTTSYTLNPTNPYPNACLPVYLSPNNPSGISAALTVDDTYSGVITPGFPFSFFGTTYNKLVVS